MWVRDASKINVIGIDHKALLLPSSKRDQDKTEPGRQTSAKEPPKKSLLLFDRPQITQQSLGRLGLISPLVTIFADVGKLFLQSGDQGSGSSDLGIQFGFTRGVSQRFAGGSVWGSALFHKAFPGTVYLKRMDSV